VFAEVIRHHHASLHALHTAKKKSKPFALFLKETEAKQGRVADLIELSHQRISKYSAFFMAFSREKEADLDEMVVHLNRLQYFVEISKRSSRDQGKLLELEVKLAMPEYLNQGLERFSLAQLGRRLIQEGVLSTHTVPTARRPSGMRQCRVFLFNDLLLWTHKPSRPFKKVLKVKCVIPLHTVHAIKPVSDERAQKYGLRISASTGEWTLYTTASEYKGWIDHIKYYAQQCIKYKTYGFSIEELMERERSECRPIPLLLEQLLQALRSNPNALRTEGIFRMAGSSMVLKQLAFQIDIGAALDFNKIDVHTLAGLLKMWLRLLPEPLFTHELHQKFLDAVGVEEGAIEALKDVTAQLPVQNKYTLRHLFGFLKEITSHSEHNKMGSHNLAIVFGPNLLNRRGASTQDHGAEVHQQQKVVQEMIDSYDHIFSGIEEEENLFVEQMRLMCEEKQDLLKHGAMAIHNLGEAHNP